MGRRDAVQVTLEVIARMRALEPRLQVTWERGWETRGNGTSANYEGGIVHHTATPSSLTRPFPTQNLLRVGRIDLSGPLCNEAGPACTVDAPRIHVMAAHPANHAGASGGRSMGPLPVTSLFNPRVRGLEIDYAGTVPMLAGQLYVAHLWARANADVVGGGDIQRIRAHFETSVTGKVDIGFGPGRSYDMAAFRRDAAQISAAVAEPPQEEDVPIIIVASGRPKAVLAEGFFIPMNEKSDEPKNWAAAGAKEVWVMPGTWDLYHAAQNKSAAVLEQIAAKPAAGAVTIDVPDGFAAQLADAVNDEDDRRDRDGDPATGPVS